LCYDALVSTEPDSLILTYLRRLDAKVDRLADDMQDVKRRLTSLEGQVAAIHGHIAGLHGDFAGQSARLDRIEARLDQIERRLDMSAFS
jgi:tetrahydromethanopterin S-methyltransferase subunit G